MLKEAISKVVEKQNLSSNEANQVMNEIIPGNALRIEDTFKYSKF